MTNARVTHASSKESVEASVRACHATEGAEGHEILVAVKPADSHNPAIGMAEWLAKRQGRELHIVSVIERTPMISSLAAGVPFIPRFHDEGERKVLERELRAAVRRPGQAAVSARIDVLDGEAAPTIGDIARERDASLVVVGKGTQGLLGHLVYGEHVREIFRQSRRPVLIVPPAAAPPIDRAMVAFDFSAASLRAAVIASGMLGPGGRLTLVHVATPRRVTGRRGDWWLRTIERRTRETLGEFAGALAVRAGVIVEMEKLHGDPVTVLTAYAQSQGVQLLACGWHEHAHLMRLWLESSAVELLHRAECAVLVTPEAGDGGRGDETA
jgi:nucleotide-binding universal stress UspA family protein